MAKEKPDSLTHHEERRARMKSEYDKNEEAEAIAAEERQEKQTRKDAEARVEEARVLTQHTNLLEEGETRDHLLERIRKLREDTPVQPAPVGHFTEYQKQVRAIEEEAGRQAVARAEKQMRDAQKLREAAEKERLKREGSMTPVHHPNPGQNEQFPTQGPAMGKKK